MNWPVVLEKRSEPSPRLRYVLPAVAIGIGLLLGAMVLSFMGTHPGEAYQEMARGAFGSVYGLSETLVKATPLLLAGLGVGVAFRAGFWNIGAEGQLYMGAMELSLVPLLLEAAVRAGTPILLVALGELLAERAGILNLGVEGMMLVGALTGFIVSQQSGEPWIGVLAAAMAGVMLSCVHASLSISLHANQVGSGLALTIFGTGLSGLLGKSFVGVPAKGFAPIAVPWLADVPLLGRMFFQHDPLVYVAYLLVPGLWVLLYRTRPGLKVRAVGEHPTSADALGISVVVVRYSCVLAGGSAAGLGGAYLSLAYTQMWVDNMTAGRGWIALAMVIFGGWNPVRTALGAYLFGGVQALQLRLQAIGVTVPTYLLMMTPYAFTILALIIASASRARGHVGTPTALGRVYIRGE